LTSSSKIHFVYKKNYTLSCSLSQAELIDLQEAFKREMLSLSEVEEKFERWKRRPELDAAVEKRSAQLDGMREEWSRLQTLADQRTSKERQVWGTLRGVLSGVGAKARRRKTASGSSANSSSGIHASELDDAAGTPTSLPRPPQASSFSSTSAWLACGQGETGEGEGYYDVPRTLSASSPATNSGRAAAYVNVPKMQ